MLVDPSSADNLDLPFLGISETMVSTLVELYFDHVYNAPLLLHRQSFVDAVAVGTVRRDILLAVCALGSMQVIVPDW